MVGTGGGVGEGGNGGLEGNKVYRLKWRAAVLAAGLIAGTVSHRRPRCDSAVQTWPTVLSFSHYTLYGQQLQQYHSRGNRFPIQ